MDFAQLYNQISGYVDPVVVFLVIVFTEILKRFLPTPIEAESKSDVTPGLNRLMPVAPLAFGVIFLYLKSHWGCAMDVFMGTVLIKGLVSGGIGAYVYRTYKVTILGG